MPFATRKALCEAIDNADHAIQCAVKDGNLFDVFKQFKHELVHIYHHYQYLGWKKRRPKSSSLRKMNCWGLNWTSLDFCSSVALHTNWQPRTRALTTSSSWRCNTRHWQYFWRTKRRATVQPWQCHHAEKWQDLLRLPLHQYCIELNQRHQRQHHQ